MSKFTPGGWFVAEHNWNAASVYTKEKTVCLLSISEEEATEENQSDLSVEMLANARLIAAAPQMLEALERLRGWVVAEAEQFGAVLPDDDIMEQATAAIRAAKGEA